MKKTILTLLALSLLVAFAPSLVLQPVQASSGNAAAFGVRF